MSDESTTGGSYRIKLLKGTNWMPWKCRMMAILYDLGLEGYVEEGAKMPVPADEDAPTKEEDEKKKKWLQNDAKARTRIMLAVSDSQMIHIS